MTQSVQEFYITYSESLFKYKYLRSTDGGFSWSGGAITFGIGGPRVRGGFAAQPAVSGSGPLYVAYPQTQTEIRFLVAQDFNDGTVEFTQITDMNLGGPIVPPLSVPLNAGGDDYGGFIPGLTQNFPKRIPQLAADPTDPNTLYLVYHDVVSSGPPVSTDSDVFFRKLTRVTFNGWLLGPRIRVNDDNPLVESDQFMPSIVVDNQGRIHVVFFDDRRFDQDDSDSTAKFDAFYAFSINGGQNWFNQRLFLDPNDPQEHAALDLGVAPIGYPIKEYIGITFYEDSGGTHVMTAYHGTDPDEMMMDPDKTVIWSSRIDWAP